MGFGLNRILASVPAASITGRAHRPLFSGGWAGIELQDPGTAGAGVSLPRAPTPSPFALFTVPLGGT